MTQQTMLDKKLQAHLVWLHISNILLLSFTANCQASDKTKLSLYFFYKPLNLFSDFVTI